MANVTYTQYCLIRCQILFSYKHTELYYNRHYLVHPLYNGSMHAVVACKCKFEAKCMRTLSYTVISGLLRSVFLYWYIQECRMNPFTHGLSWRKLHWYEIPIYQDACVSLIVKVACRFHSETKVHS